MWWTAITLAGVAAWFEWTYRRNRKAAGQNNKGSQAPENPVEEELDEPDDIPSSDQRGIESSEQPSFSSKERSVS
jgi:hypothetical protein